jgi:hypothetical protein
MIFFDWWFVAELLVVLGLVAAGVLGLSYSRKISGRLVRAGTGLAGTGFAIVGSLLGVLLLAFAGCRSHSIPIYSPSGKMAVRVENADEGATGGSTDVRLFWAYGLGQQTVYSGPETSVEPKDIHWKNDSELEIRYFDKFSSDAHHCVNQGKISVSCSSRPH